jgi:hypothetical protein
MSAKITLITPPDIFQNDRTSVLFIDLTDQDQDEVTKWLSKSNSLNLNIYYFQGEPTIPWLLFAISVSTFKYLNLNNTSAVSSYLLGYIISKDGVYYSTNDQNVADLYSHLNHNRVNNAVDFLEKVFGGTK